MPNAKCQISAEQRCSVGRIKEEEEGGAAGKDREEKQKQAVER